MPRGPIPESFHDLLESNAFAFVATLGKGGEPQVSPIWFLWNGARIQFGLLGGSQRHVNLERDQRVAIAIANPANPYRYLEVRGRVDAIEPDIDETVFTAISTKYTGGPFSLEPEGTVRSVATVTVERHTFQDSSGIPSPT